jgi:2-polyprenyl-3-methyl-5-hydroxy-6-metoxy-1,4-benzoquinol methylase
MDTENENKSQEKADEMLNLTRDGYDAIAADWHSTRLTFWAELIDKIKVHIQPNTKVLDVGCGNGRILKVLSDYNLDYTGVDVSTELIKLAQHDFPDFEFHTIDTKLEYLKDTVGEKDFDQVISIAVLHHIPPIAINDWLTNIYNTLKPDTVSIFTTWNLEKSTYTLDEHNDAVIGFMHHKDVRYVHYYNYTEIREVFEKVGFEIIEISDVSRESGMTNTVAVVRKN